MGKNKVNTEKLKLLFINGSPDNNGVLSNIFDYLEKISDCNCIKVNIPNQISNCINCRKCKDNSNYICDTFIEKNIHLIQESDAIILGSPVYYGGITSQMKSFLTKLFYSNPKICNYKPIGLIVSSRRAGSVMALSEFSLPFLMHSNIIVGSTYWNEIHGDNYEEALCDYEGVQTFENLIENIKYTASGLKQIQKPQPNKIKHFNYISREYLDLKKEKNL